jgi:glycosyltransferase involved in cell wall biosynthesis
MAKAVIRLIQDKELAQKISANAVQTAGKFTWQRTAEQTLQVYREVLQEKNPNQSRQRS